MTWLILRGLAREARHWENFPEILAQRTNKEVYCLDLPGFGNMQNVPSPRQIKDITDNLRQRWLNKNINPPCSLLAMSLGAMVAMDWQERYPDDFSELVLIGTSSKKYCRIYERLKPKVIPQLLNILKAKGPIQREKAILKMVSKNTGCHDSLAQKWTKFSPSMNDFLLNGINQIIAATTYNGPSSLNVRTLFLAGKGDEMVSSNCSVKLAKKLKANYALHPWGGHDLAIDDPNWIVEQYLSWQ